MPAKLTIIGESDIQRLVLGQLKGDEVRAIKEVIEHDPAARRYYEALLSANDREQGDPMADRVGAIGSRPTYRRRHDNGSNLRSVLIAAAFVVAATSIGSEHFYLWIGTVGSSITGTIQSAL